MLDRVTGMQVFARAATLGSLSAAARALGMSQTMATKHLDAIEQRLGVKLLHRTTRRMTLTEAGRRYLESTERILAEIAEADATAAAVRLEARGVLRLNAPISFGVREIAPLLPEFCARHPGLEIDLGLNDRYVDLLEEGWDMAIRIGRLAESTLVARKLADSDAVVCAAPAYLYRRGTPADPRDLLAHECLCVRENNEDVTLWHHRRNGKAGAIRVTPTLTSNDGEVVRNWAVAGLGIVLRSQWDAAPFVKRGDLKRILAPWDFDGADILALVPARRGISARVSQFVEFLKGDFKRKAPWS